MNWKATLIGLLIGGVFGWAVLTYAQTKLVDGNEAEVGTTANPLIMQLGDGTDTALVDSNGNQLVSLGTNIAADAGDSIKQGPIFTDGSSTETPLTLQRVVIDLATSGDQTVVSGTGGQVVRVHGIEYFANAANNITLKCASTTVLPVQNFVANQGVIRDVRADAWYVCGDGEAFIVNLSASQQLSGIVYYTQG
jgi:hypothetical protein